MKKKLISALTLGLMISQVAPLVVYADNIQIQTTNTKNLEVKNKDYPNLIYLNKTNIKDVKYNQDVEKSLDELIARVDDLEKDYSQDKTKAILQDFLKLHESLSNEESFKHSDNDKFDYIALNLIYINFNNLQGKEKDDMFINLTDSFYHSSAIRINTKHGNFFTTEYCQYLGYDLVDYFKDKETKRILAYGASMSTTLNSSFQDANNNMVIPDDELPSKAKPTIPNKPDEDDPDVYVPEEVPNKPDKPDIPSVKPDKPNDGGHYTDNSNTTEEETVVEGDNVYVIIREYDKDGKLVSVKKKLISKCKPAVDGNTWNKIANKNQASMGIANNIWEGLARNDLNKKSNLSIQFTLNKDSSKPYYYDSGISVPLSKSVTYTQIKDVLTQISYKVNGYVIEDKDRLLFIAEGKPLVVVDKHKDYSESELGTLLNNFEKIGLSIRTIQDKETLNINDVMSIDTLSIDNKESKFKNKPVLEDSILLLPIEEVGTKLGYNVEKNNNKYILTKDKSKIEYEVNSTKLVINGNEKIMSTATKMKDNVLYGNMNLVAQDSGLNIIHQDNSNKIEIQK